MAMELIRRICQPPPRRRLRWLLIAASSLPLLAGCLSPIALDRAAIAYNQTTADILSKQLLLNIARARHNDPIHFSGISNITATFNFQANAGATPALTGEASSTMMPMFGISASESPTVSIIPMEGEEFTKRLLTPLPENKITLLLRQNIDVDLLLRLVAQDFRLRGEGKEEFVYHNRPSYQDNYAHFRRIALHLSSIQDHNLMHAEPLMFERKWTLPAQSMTAEGFSALEKEFFIQYEADKSQYHLSKTITGQTIITNYNPSLLSNQERMRLNDEAEMNAPNDLEIDIRSSYPGGEYPLRGKFRLRSFLNILSFIGRTITPESEYHVEKDPRTPDVSENPAAVLRILESAEPLSDAELSIEYKGYYYSVLTEEKYPWNKTAFRLLAQIFQMTMAELPRNNAPSITIAK